MNRHTAIVVLSVLLASTLGCASTIGVREGGFNLISLEQEWEMRDDFKKEVAKEFTLVRDRKALQYINRLGMQLVAETNMAEREWDFGIVKDDSLNAFNLPGGLVYINTGLIESADSIDQLVGVLSHEIAHGTGRHGTQLMTRQIGYSTIASILLGEDPGAMKELLAGVVGAGILNDYSRDAEREADRNGFRTMVRAGYNPGGMTAFFKKLLELQARTPSHVERFFSSHPITRERIDSIEEMRKTVTATGLTHDTPEYQRFRKQIR